MTDDFGFEVFTGRNAKHGLGATIDRRRRAMHLTAALTKAMGSPTHVVYGYDAAQRAIGLRACAESDRGAYTVGQKAGAVSAAAFLDWIGFHPSGSLFLEFQQGPDGWWYAELPREVPG